MKRSARSSRNPGKSPPAAARSLRRVVSGGQTGADRGGLDAAIDVGIPHGGWCPRGRLAEDGSVPERYRLAETETEDYRERTRLNVLGSDGTVVFVRGSLTEGSALTARLARRHRKPLLVIDLKGTTVREARERLLHWMVDHGVAILNVAGSRESKSPGIQQDVWRIVSWCVRQAYKGQSS